MRSIVAAGAIVALTLGAAAQAMAQPTSQDVERRGYVGVGGGVTFGTGDFGDATKIGWMVHGFGGYTTRGGMWGGRLDASYGQNALEGDGGNVKTFGATANLVLTPGRRPADFHPYFFAGAGGYRAKQTDLGGEWAFALQGGAGLQLHLGRRTDIFLEGRWLHLFTDNAANIIPVTAGFRWGGI
ncbi:MAG: outer membrane beta-barrel protein [Gemmatimonadales bacterium]